MASVSAILSRMRRGERVRFAALCKVCDFYFGSPRLSGGSHRVYKTTWQGDPRINIQSSGGEAKAYQVKQVMKAIDKLEQLNGQ